MINDISMTRQSNLPLQFLGNLEILNKLRKCQVTGNIYPQHSACAVEISAIRIGLVKEEQVPSAQ